MQQPTKKPDEKILVVPRQKLFDHVPVSGIQPLNDFDYYQNLIEKNQEFLWRSEMETDPTYKQIIPYLVFSHNEKLFLMQRTSTASETRLQNKYTLGIGGHIRAEDMGTGTIFDWARREFHEEVDYQGSLTFTPIGLINDDETLVGQVHLGCAFLLEGDNNSIRVRSELKSGILVSMDECESYYERMETWSQIVFQHLKQKR